MTRRPLESWIWEEFCAWRPAAQLVYLRNAHWADRCQCTVYGFPWPEVGLVRDNWGDHERRLCQPAHEVIPPEVVT